MKQVTGIVKGLAVEGCQSRQTRIVEKLRSSGAGGILICDRRHIYYFSGYFAASYHAPLMLIAADGKSHLVAPDGTDATNLAAERISFYESQRLGTLVEDQLGAALRVIASDIPKVGGLGIDIAHFTFPQFEPLHDLSSLIATLRRAKEADEAELVSQAIRGCEAAYARAAEILQPGIREIDVFAEMQAAAVKEVGEPIGEMGNDFQAGTTGGPPRNRAIERGELMPLDVSVSLRGYRCDLCRTFVIGGEPTASQRQAFELVEGALRHVENNVTIGGSCRRLFDEVKKLLDGTNGWQFPHHLGHGTGLSPHEAPRINPNWDDRFEIGDLFTVEPGVYHEELRAGVRIEENYWLAPDGLRRLSKYPTEV